jgi:glutamate N-acetyltransferase/amino-acid N-acetyltransferase
MPVGLKQPGQLHAVDGIRLAAMHCGIKADEKVSDLVLIEITESANCAAVFTTNKFCAAPVVVARQHLVENNPVRYLLINSGNANAGTGDSGYQGALDCCAAVADHGAVQSTAVLPFSTGVIAVKLPVTKIKAAITPLFSRLHEDHWLQAAKGIMTTDILPKAISEVIQLAQGQTITITGMAKGSGMIKPDMATMLAFVATDAKIKPSILQQYLQQVVDDSFNAITVDGDTSTNDACVLIATGQSGVSIEASNQVFVQALMRIFQHLSQSVIRDGEGATKFVEIEVQQAASRDEAREVGFTIAHSPLVKTALFACDPNWGRILAAIGRAKIETLDVSKVDLYLGEVCLLKNGLPDSAYHEDLGQKEMDREDIRITVKLGQGEASAMIWTTDLSYDYVKINAEYRS